MSFYGLIYTYVKTFVKSKGSNCFVSRLKEKSRSTISQKATFPPKGLLFKLMLFPFQDIPTYCLTLTLLVLCLDRHQVIRHPDQAPLPMPWVLGLVWAVSIVLVLPYMAYITHVDLSVRPRKLNWLCLNIRTEKPKRQKWKQSPMGVLGSKTRGVEVTLFQIAFGKWDSWHTRNITSFRTRTNQHAWLPIPGNRNLKCKYYFRKHQSQGSIEEELDIG